MTSEGGALVALASSIADGNPVDWERAEASAVGDYELELVRSLRVIASIGEVHRTADELLSASVERLHVAASPSARAAMDDDARGEEGRGRIVGRIGPDRSARIDQQAAPDSRDRMGRVKQDDPPSSRAGAPAPRSRDGAPFEAPPAAEPVERWGHLDLKERVGAGVFGEVYRAHDPQLQREVAVKLLKTGSRPSDLLASKVLHEGRLLARVRHPNVVTVHGVETHGDRVGLWMEFVRGCTLAELLDRQGSFSGREAALIGQDVCRALAAVHGAGLVHRDVKAQNVIREEGGRVVLMDFGTGLPLDNEAAVRHAPIAGTPLYLAPEVLAGRDASPASDVYSVGVLLFHLVTGTYPFAARSLAELRQAQKRGERKRLHDLRPDLPESFVQVVERATEADPALRYQSAGALQQGLGSALGFDAAASAGALSVPAPSPAVVDRPAWRPSRRGLVWGGVTAAGIALAVWASGRVTSGPVRPIGSLVVLPLVNVGPQNQDLAQGIELLVNDRLAGVSNIRLVRYTEEMRRRDRGVAIGDVIARHEVGGAIQGTVTWTGSAATVEVQLVRAGSSTPAWVRRFERPARRAIELPRDVAREIVRALAVQLTPADEARLAEADSASPNVFEAYLRGRAQMRVLTDHANARAIEYLLDALRQDPNHAPSLAALAECYLLDSVTYRVRPIAEGAVLARQAVEHALSLDDDLAVAHDTYAQLKFFADWDGKGADESYRRAIALAPNVASMRQNYAMFLVSRRRIEEALVQMQTAITLDPSSSQARGALGMIWHYARRYDDAERVFRGVLDGEPASLPARFGLARTLIAAKRYAEALSHLDEMRRLTGDRLTPAYRAGFGLAYAGMGRTADARALAERLAAEDTQDGPSIDAATIFGSIGDSDRAIELLDQAVAERVPRVVFVPMDPRYDPLRPDRRFARLMDRIESGS